MIVEEFMDDGVRVIHYSSIDKKIRQQQTGVLYRAAVDLVPCAYTYEETDIPIEHEENMGGSEALEILDILLGEDNNDN